MTPLPIYRLRRWLAVITVLFSAVVVGMYVYARMRQHSVLKDFPGKISYNVKQTASGFQFSKSEAGRTVFTIQAKDVKEFKFNGRAELHGVSITLYGRDATRFDRIYGDDFSYDPKSGEVTGRGEVMIDLEANPGGLKSADQSAPKEVKNPIHLKTSDLVFNRESGDASTSARVEFNTPQANGSATGMQYSAESATLTMGSEVVLALEKESDKIYAAHATITRDPREITLQHARMERPSGTLQAEEAIFFLGPENEVQRITATGAVRAESKGDVESEKTGHILARADHAELSLAGKQSVLRTATLHGNVHAERTGAEPMQGDAGTLVLDFIGENVIQKARASDGVRLTERQTDGDASGAQNYDITAAAIDFFIGEGRKLERAQTSGAAKITIAAAQGAGAGNAHTGNAPQKTVITAGRFDARFDSNPGGASHLALVHGTPDARIVSTAAGVPDRVSTSESVDAAFLPKGGLASIVQQGSVAYTDGLPAEKRTQAWASKAVYAPASGMIALTGEPRVMDGGMTTTANTVRINRESGDALADGDVKSTYSDLKEQPDGAWLGSASPIHVTAAKMTAHHSPAVALYEGNARLWQDANVVQAPSIQFERDSRTLVAYGSAAQPVSTVLVQGRPGGWTSSGAKSERKSVAPSAVTITSERLTYSDSQRKAHYGGGVTARGADFRARADGMDVYFSAKGQGNSNQLLSASGSLDHMVAQGHVNIQGPGRRADCETMVYTASDDKFVLTGGPPSIFDAEQGKITGDSLTFFRADDRVLVEGRAGTPVVTQTRVAR